MFFSTIHTGSTIHNEQYSYSQILTLKFAAVLLRPTICASSLFYIDWNKNWWSSVETVATYSEISHGGNSGIVNPLYSANDHISIHC